MKMINKIVDIMDMKVGSGNLSLPIVDEYYTQNGIVRFGEDNLYPQLLNQMYYTSPSVIIPVDIESKPNLIYTKSRMIKSSTKTKKEYE